MPKATVQNAGISLFALMLSGMVAYAAEPTRPRTLENLLAVADGEPQAAVVADEAPNEAEEPPAAPKDDPLQRRLDAALAEYNPAIERAIDELAKEIEEEFNKATKKGDVELARKSKEAEETLREKGTPPKDDFLKHAREDAYRKITRAGAKLTAEFEAVAKECLRAGDLDRAEAVLSEKAELLAEMKGWKGVPPARRTQANVGHKHDVPKRMFGHYVGVYDNNQALDFLIEPSASRHDAILVARLPGCGWSAGVKYTAVYDQLLEGYLVHNIEGHVTELYSLLDDVLVVRHIPTKSFVKGVAWGEMLEGGMSARGVRR